MNLPPFLLSALYFAVGAGLGLVYFSLLGNTVRQFVEHGSLKRALPLYLARIILAVAIFGLLARQGTLPLLLALLGFLSGRLLVLRVGRFHA